MKKLMISILALSFSIAIFAQSQAETFINEASGYVKAKNYKQAQMSLQDAINEINNLLAKEVMAQLPTEINGLKAQTDNDNTSSAGMGMLGGGMTIGRTYQSADGKQKGEVNIISNSPMISSMSMMLNNPMFMTASNNQKAVRVGTRRAILKNDKSTQYDDNGTSKEIGRAHV